MAESLIVQFLLKNTDFMLNIWNGRRFRFKIIRNSIIKMETMRNIPEKQVTFYTKSMEL